MVSRGKRSKSGGGRAPPAGSRAVLQLTPHQPGRKAAQTRKSEQGRFFFLLKAENRFPKRRKSTKATKDPGTPYLILPGGIRKESGMNKW